MTKRYSSQAGFGAVGVILGLALVGVIGVAGWMAYQNMQAAKTSTAASPSISPTASATPDTKGYLVIKEWGIKFKIADADKLTYTYFTQTKNPDEPDSSIGLVVKPEFLKDKTCELSVGYSRYAKSIFDPTNEPYATKIGEYYYMGNGSPYRCNDDADNTINTRIRNELSTSKLVEL